MARPYIIIYLSFMKPLSYNLTAVKNILRYLKDIKDLFINYG